MMLSIKADRSEYAVVIEPGCTQRADRYLALDRKVLIVTDDGVPRAYAERIGSFCAQPTIVSIEPGEASKSIAVWESLLYTLLTHGFTRSDCVVAVGGGVVGDLAGFVAASYMRGIDFYNVPTTVLAQVDSSIGGKTALNFEGIKNIVGAFYRPRAVLIDTDLLATLPKRHVANGLAEAIKMSLTCDAELFSLMEREPIDRVLPTVIQRSVQIKQRVVEADEEERGLRKILNFGHTIGHGIESCDAMRGFFHGECVALGMLPMCSSEVRKRVLPVLKKVGLPTHFTPDTEKVLAAVAHDKKTVGETVSVTLVDAVGSCRQANLSHAEIRRRLAYFNEEERI